MVIDSAQAVIGVLVWPEGADYLVGLVSLRVWSRMVMVLCVLYLGPMRS